MNYLKDIVNKLEGFCMDRTGFSVLEAKKMGDWISLEVEGYTKEEESPDYYCSEAEDMSMLTVIKRIEAKKAGTDFHWTVIKIEELSKGKYSLTLRKEGTK